jgi:hypothetical protein
MSDKIASEDSPIRPDRQIPPSDSLPLRSSRLQSLKLWLEDKIEFMSFGVALLFAFSCWFFTDDAIKLLPISDNQKSSIQQSGIFIILFLTICAIIIFWIQQRQKQQTTKIKDDLLELKEKHFEILEENGQLKEELSQSREKIRSLCEGYLYSLANGPLKFSTIPQKHERITLYAHDYDHFIPIGRVSFTPEYAKKGRPSYPEKEGCIAQTWKNGWHFANDYPDPGVDPEGYSRRCKIDNLSDENFNAIGMKSRLYCGYRISDTSGKKQMAVLIIEATDPNRYTEVALKKILNEEEKRKYLQDMTEQIAPIMPSCKQAKEEGY